MQRVYDLFEQFPDGSPLWRGRAAGLADVRRKLAEIAKQTANECFAIHLSTKEIVARVNVGGLLHKGRKPLVAQIAYQREKAAERKNVLRAQGFEVVTVIGNEAAKLVLDLSQGWNFFIVGHAAPEEVREQMVAWLKDKFPSVPVLALNPPAVQDLSGADYNVRQNGPELWLPIVTAELGRRPDASVS
jgi:hypothetical protein